MVLTMVMSLLPVQVAAQELTHLSHAGGQDAAKSIATQNIGPNEAEVAGDLYNLLSARASLIKLIDDIDFDTLPIDYEVTLDLNGHVLRTPYGGSVIKVENGGNLTIIDSNSDAEHKFTPNADGLWVLDEANGTKTVKGGVITGGTGTVMTDFTCGGGVLIESGGRLTMTGGNIVGCTAAGYTAFGGGVFVAGSGTFTMTGGSITGCTAVAQGGLMAAGGGIRNHYNGENNIGNTTLSGTAEIRDCHAKGGSGLYGGGISDGGTLNISGDVKIIGCTAGGQGSDAMYINPGKSSSITGGMFYGSITGSSMISGITVTYKANNADYATQILQSGEKATKPTDPTNSAGAAFLGWYRADGTAYDFTTAVTENLTLAARFAAVTRGVDTKEALIAALADTTVDVIKLKSDIAIDATLIVDRAVTLDLVGYMLEMKGSGSVIAVKNGGHLTLVDSDLTSTYYFTPDADGLWKWGTSGTKTVYGGVIYGGTGTEMYYSTYGGGVLIEPGGQFTMNGGSIVGCKADGSGGGVVVQCGDANGIFTMNSGAIIGCVADSGGGVETDGGGVGEYGQFTMNGGVIDSCVATGRTGGGGVRSDGLFIMGKDATIKNCKAVENGQLNFGSGIVLAGDDQQTINGTIISEDAVDGNYIFVNHSTVTIGENANIHANITLDGGKINLDGSSATVYGKITNDSYGGVSGYVDGLVTVTYNVKGTDYATQILRSGSAATKPTDPARTGHSFDGWYTSDGAKWDFTTAVTEDTTLTGSLYVPVTNESELVAALADDTVDIIRLTDDIDLTASLTILRKLILDLNGYVLRMTGSGSVIILHADKDSTTTGDLTIIDSDPTAEHKFKVNGVEPWVLDNSGTETVYGGVITGGTGSRIFFSNGVEGGGVIIGNGALTMNGGNIVGCIANNGGGLFLTGGSFTMNGGSILGCSTPNRLTTGEAFYGGIYAFGPWSTGGTDGVITLTGGFIKNNGRYDINLAYNTILYANGGEVYGQVYVGQHCNVTSLPGHTGVTAFRGKTEVNSFSNGVDQGIFYGGLTVYGEAPTGLTVTYMINGVEYAKQVLPSGTLATRPDDPTTLGYTFGGWNKADGTAWDYATDTVTESITLYADLKAKTYTVTFDTAGGLDIATKTMTATYGKSLANMPVPRREGYVFLGWYDAMVGGKCYGNSNGNGTDAYDKDGNITLYAQWMEAPDCTVRFETDGGTMTDPAEVGHKINTPIAKPSDPTKAGYTFTGWYTDLTYTQLWNFDDWVTGEMMLYAGWKVNQYMITFDTAGGSKIASITQDYGTTITAPADPTRKGYTFIGWDMAIPTTMPAENMTITAKWKVNQYTIIFDTNGGSDIASITQDYGTAITAPANPTREGYTFIGWDKAIPATMPAENITIKARWKDIEKPTGEIIIGTNKWSTFLTELTSGLFFKDMQEVTINAADNSGIVFVSYFVTDHDLSEAELKSLVYRAYEDPFHIDSNGEYIIYVMLVDESLNITYLRSDRITLDNIQPVISGIKDGKTYCEAQTVTIIEKYIDTVTVNGTAVTLDENNSFVLSPANGKQKIVVTDKAGNKTEMTVTVNDGHTLLADDGDCTTPVYCKFCNAEVIAAKNHSFTGNWQNDETDHWHICQNENCTVIDTKTAHSGNDDGNCLTEVVCECGYVITAAKSAHTFDEWASNGDGTHTRKCTVNGCNGIETEDCSGGTATCREQAVCEVCHSAYGERNATNHVGGTEIRGAKSQNCTEDGYTGDTYCKGCGEKLSSGTVINADGHRGGMASCTDQAECEICHEKYGEPDSSRHPGLEKIDAIPATAASTGTLAHWRCAACGRLYADADGKHEISSEDTIIKKLAPSILDGANSEWRKGNENGLTFSSDAAFSDFVEVLVDGKTVASENYVKQEGGIIVELKASYLETLAEGEHTLIIRSASGDATTRFTIAASDSTNAWVWIIICFIALGIGVTVAVFVVRKRKTA